MSALSGGDWLLCSYTKWGKVPTLYYVFSHQLLNPGSFKIRVRSSSRDGEPGSYYLNIVEWHFCNRIDI